MGRARAVLRAVLPPIVLTSTRPMRRQLSYRRARLSPDALLSDGVVALRFIDPRDRKIIERASRDPQITRRFRVLRERPDDYFAHFWERAHAGEDIAFAISDVGGPCVGVVTVERRGSGRVDLGYWLLPEGRGRGRATRAVRLVARWALNQPGLARVQLLTTPDNERSLRLAERSGFTREGLLRSYQDVLGQREDIVMFSLIASDLIAATEPTVTLADALTHAVNESVRGRTADVEITFEGPEDVLVPRDVVVPVVASLLENAVVYGRDGVVVHAEASPSDVSVTVEDRGRGIDRSLVPSLFDPQAPSKRLAAEVRGRGLGLSRARSTARAHGGDVRYEPRRGGGTRLVAVFSLTSGRAD